MPGRLRGFAAVLFLGVTVVAACEGQSSAMTCRTNADCEDGQRCVTDSAKSRERIPGCPSPACESDASCPEGQFCAFEYSCYICRTKCTPSSCAADELCTESGACALQACDAPGAPPCPEYWRCDPAATMMEGLFAFGTLFYDGVDDPAHALRRGCIRKQCDEEGGIPCLETWSCDPSTAHYASGCLPPTCAPQMTCPAGYVCIDDSAPGWNCVLEGEFSPNPGMTGGTGGSSGGSAGTPQAGSGGSAQGMGRCVR